MTAPSPPTLQRVHRTFVGLLVLVLLALSTVLTEAGRTRLEGWWTIVTSAFEKPAANALFSNAAASALSPEQARTARWIARRYRVALAPIEQIVQHAFESGSQFRVDPYLVLAVIAVESRFNPVAESSVGAMGLMQVMPQVHRERFQRHGGTDAALNPWANIDVGAGILREYLDRYKTIEAALSAYVGMGPAGQTQYPEKVLRMRERLYAAAQGRVLA
ncbi:MAG: transglycosylase SLT domain-containing protein [Burkholderiaceae bacterium]